MWVLLAQPVLLSFLLQIVDCLLLSCWKEVFYRYNINILRRSRLLFNWLNSKFLGLYNFSKLPFSQFWLCSGPSDRIKDHV
jgi:hypothetical protein